MEVLTKTLHTIMPFAQLGLTMLLIIWATGLTLLLKRQTRQQGAVAANLQKELAAQAEAVATLNNRFVEMQRQIVLDSVKSARALHRGYINMEPCAIQLQCRFSQIIALCVINTVVFEQR